MNVSARCAFVESAVVLSTGTDAILDSVALLSDIGNVFVAKIAYVCVLYAAFESQESEIKFIRRSGTRHEGMGHLRTKRALSAYLPPARAHFASAYKNFCRCCCEQLIVDFTV